MLTRTSRALPTVRQSAYSLVPRLPGRPASSRTYHTSVANNPARIADTLVAPDVVEQERRIFLPSFGTNSGFDLMKKFAPLLYLPNTKIIIPNNEELSTKKFDELQNQVSDFHRRGGGGIILVGGSSPWARISGVKQREQLARLFIAIKDAGVAPMVPLRLDGDQAELESQIDYNLDRGVGGFTFHPLYKFDILNPKNKEKLIEIAANPKYGDLKMMAGTLALDAAFYKQIGEVGTAKHRNGKDVYRMNEYAEDDDFDEITRQHLRESIELMAQLTPKQDYKDISYTREGLGHGSEKRELIAAFMSAEGKEIWDAARSVQR